MSEFDPSPPSPEALTALEEWVRSALGIDYTPDQRGTFTARVTTLCREQACGVPHLLTRLAAGDRDTTLRVAEAMSTNHTLFFREQEAFDYLAREIVPQLPGGELRIWSAAASSGDEACSLAITLLESLGGSAAARVKILGTDLSARQIRAAEQGVYPVVQLQRVSQARRRQWFTPAGLGQFAVVPEVRRMCTFRRLNLTQLPWGFAQRFHVVFLRNVLYYFTASMRRTVIEACYDATEPGGWLITSFTEPMLDLVTRWTSVQPGVFRRGGTS